MFALRHPVVDDSFILATQFCIVLMIVGFLLQQPSPSSPILLLKKEWKPLNQNSVQYALCKFHYCDFSKLSKNIWLIRFYMLFIFFTAIILLSNAILCAIYFITAINLPNAIFWLMRLFPSPSIDLL